MITPAVASHDLGEGTKRRSRVRYGPELRVLIVGGGIAGLTLAALLEQRGFAPLVVERGPLGDDEGFVIGLWPAGSRILKGLKLFSKLCDIGVPCSHYIIANTHGETLHAFSFETLAREYGPLIDVSRRQLVDLLRSVVDTRRLRFGVTIRELSEKRDDIVAVFDDGTAEAFDVVVACDGIHSETRNLVFEDVSLDYCGVAGWVFWLPPDFVPPPEVVEYWGRGKFLGVYPTRDRFCAVAAMASPPNADDSPDTRIERVRSAFGEFGGIVPWVLRELPAAERMVRLEFSELHLEEWAAGRVVLIGDAAHAILPTTGMGATLAMESAAVLAEELCRTDSRFLNGCLQQFETRRRPRVEKIQSQSHRLARVMFAGNGLVTRLRDTAVRIMADEPVVDAMSDMLASCI